MTLILPMNTENYKQKSTPKSLISNFKPLNPLLKEKIFSIINKIHYKAKKQTNQLVKSTFIDQ